MARNTTTVYLACCLGAVGLTIAGCSGEYTRADSGTLVGAVAGGIVGNQFGGGRGRAVATVAGALIGGIVGNQVGQALDERDRELASRAELTALEDGESGRAVPWRNPDSGHYGEVVPQRSYERAERTCRDYEHRVWIDGRREVITGTACRRSDGTWTTVS